MYRRIYKYIFADRIHDLEDEIIINTHANPVPLCIKKQYGSYALWAIIDGDSSPAVDQVRISVRGTGHPLSNDEGAYMGTIVETDFHLVFHFFCNVM